MGIHMYHLLLLLLLLLRWTAFSRLDRGPFGPIVPVPHLGYRCVYPFLVGEGLKMTLVQDHQLPQWSPPHLLNSEAAASELGCSGSAV